MGNLFSKFTQTLKGHKNVLFIIAAALLVELFSAAQYYFAHNLLEKELDNRAESELRMKAILIRGILNVMEKTVGEHIWDIKRNIAQPDSMFNVATRIIQNTPKAEGSCLVFTPGFYPSKDRLFEPYAYKTGNGIQVKDLCGDDSGHDYTRHPAYKKMEKELEPFWSDPYINVTDSTEMALTTYSYPLKDKNDKLIAICGLDVSLEQIGDTLNAHHIYPSSFNLLLTNSGEIISGPSEKHPKKHDIKQVIRLINDSTVKRVTSNSGHSKCIVFKSEVDNSAGCLYYANMKGNPKWQLAVVCYDNEVYGDLYPMRLQFGLLMLLGLGVLGLIIHRFANNERKLNKARIQQELLGSELRIAQEIQMGMLPKEIQPYADRNDLQIFGSLVPAREVGGDIYDFFLRDEKLFFCIGDVSGKGAPAAMVMGVVHSLFRAFAAHETSAAHIMQGINEGTCQGNESNFFVTMFVGVLDLPTGHLRYCDAGHDAPIVLGKEQKRMLPCNPHLPVGVLDTIKYEEQETQLSPGDALFLYTDGLTEARNATNQLFGMNRVNVTLDKCFSLTPEEMLQRVIDDVRLYVTDAEQSDDLTLLALRYTPQSFESVISETLVIKNNVREMPKFGEFVKSMFGKMGLDKSMSRNIRLAVEEAVVNVMNYAYPAGEEGEIEIRLMSDGTVLRTVIIDSGVAFDPTIEKKADTSLPPEERQIGGLGILLYRELMDSINYEREGGKNILTLNKQL